MQELAERLSSYFEGIASKRLSAVEVRRDVSNQHEFNGVNELRRLFGEVTTDEPRKVLEASFLYLGEDEIDSVQDTGSVTWYDSRAANPNRSAEYRLYVPDNKVYERAGVGDLLVVAKRSDGQLLILIVKARSIYESQIRWLFDLPADDFQLQVHKIEPLTGRQLGFAGRFILAELGVEVDQADDDWLDRILSEFPNGFPTTARFSAYARQTLSGISPVDGADAALIAWMNHEEMLFRTLERHLVQDRLREPFPEVDDFISYSLSVHNRRKSRVGHALENHVEAIFLALDIRYSRGQETENGVKPDFVFPGIDEYRDKSFSSTGLVMLGVKSTCKDRWRQVLSEAARISRKHLLTLQPGISENQTAEMIANNLQLVLPAELHDTYTDAQRLRLMDLDSFVRLVRGTPDSGHAALVMD